MCRLNCWALLAFALRVCFSRRRGRFNWLQTLCLSLLFTCHGCSRRSPVPKMQQLITPYLFIWFMHIVLVHVGSPTRAKDAVVVVAVDEGFVRHRLLSAHSVHHTLRPVEGIDCVRKCRLDWNRTKTGVSLWSPGCARHAPHPVAHQPRRYTPVMHRSGHPPLGLGTEFARRVWARTTGAANRFSE